MQSTVRLSRRASYADYLAVELSSAHRHELLDGVIVAMAGGSDEHNAIAGRFAAAIGGRRRASCRYFSPDQRFWISATARARYSDGSVVCGKPDHPPHDGQATTNPVLVLEVLSPSTEGDDQGDKRLDFQSLPSLQAYVVASQDRQRVEVWRRAEGGSWPSGPEVYVHGDLFALPTLLAEIPVAEVYDDILAPDGRSLLR
ncbi:MAG: Uma2 family endonuclease [Myxococcota bacterium]